MKSNENIKQYLDDYVSHTEPGFAVMLNGNWGCGKTHFIDSYMKKAKDSFIYITLNGLKTTEQIDDEIFMKLSPRLSKVKKVITPILNAGIKFSKPKILDFIDIESSLPKLDIQKLFSNMESKIFIFDDLERCLLSPSETLGYINKYVEHNKLRVIIIANEDEIDKSEKLQKDFEQKNNADNAHLAKNENNQNQSKYKIIKEKVIGKSFRIQGDIDSALESFIEKYANEKGSFPDTVIRNNVHIIKEVYTTFGKNNLRILMQTFYDWRILWKYLDNKVKSKNDLIQELIREFFLLSFEIKGGFNPEELWNLDNDFIDYLHEQKNKNSLTNKTIYTIFSKYDYNFLELNISGKNWAYFFVNGIPDREAINNELLQSEYFYEENTPAWKRLFHYRNLSDEEFLNQFSILESELQKYEIKEPGALLIIADTFLSLLKEKIYPKKIDKKQLIKEMKSYIISMGERDYLSDPKWSDISSRGYDGLGFSEDNQDFKEVFNFLKQQIEEKVKPYYRVEAMKLLNLLKEKNPKQFDFEIYYKSNNPYAEFPIFTYFNASEFLDLLLLLDNQQIRDLSYLFKRRYAGREYQLLDELKFLMDLNRLMDIKIKKNSDKPIQNLALKEFVIALKETIDRLQTYKSNLKPNIQEANIL